jgi:uncharacterized protein YlxW (UPF0749 family)
MSYDNVNCEGVTGDFAWYELTRLQVKIQEMLSTVENLQNTLKAREREQQSYVEYLETKVRMLQGAQVKED